MKDDIIKKLHDIFGDDEYIQIPVKIDRRKAVNMAGYYLKRVLEKYGEPFIDFQWLKLGDYSYSVTDDISFRYKNKIFSVLVFLYHGKENNLIEIKKERIEKFIESCQKNNLIPCVFPMYTCGTGIEIQICPLKPAEMSFEIPKETEWNLFHIEDNSPIIPTELVTDEIMIMHQYEQTMAAIYIAQIDFIKKMEC